VTVRLTELAQAVVGRALGTGDVALDATAGNGHDTAFLARAVGPSGRVFAFDTQEAAILATRQRLREQGVSGSVTLIEDCHSRLAVRLPPALELNAAMFNLGYLPGGDKGIVTQPATTLAALVACCDRLAEGGVMSVMAYRGHPGGGLETDAVAAWLESLAGTGYGIERHDAPAEGPVLWVIRRRTS
jgi:predicted methyltransferase